MSLLFGMDPLREMRRMQRMMDRMLGESEYGAMPGLTERPLIEGGETKRMPEAQQEWFNPRTDLRESDNNYQIICELPGVNKEDVKIDMRGNVMTLSGHKRHVEEKSGDTWHSLERRFGQFSRSFTLPEGIDPSHINAEYNNGVLSVSIPKPPGLAMPEAKRIDIR